MAGNQSSVMANVDQRTKMVGQNRMELLMFRLNGSSQLFGINVFKVREVTQCPKLTVIPRSHPVIRGIANFRGSAIPVIDFGKAVGTLPMDDLSKSFVIISEYNRTVQAMIVHSVERIVNLNWSAINPPPAGTSKGGKGSYLTAVTQVDGKLVEIIDVERIIDEIAPKIKEVSAEILEDVKKEAEEQELSKKVVLVADDSMVARNQIQKTVESLGFGCVTVSDGKQALDLLKKLAEEGKQINNEFLMLISDVEMPMMDGYTLTTEIRFDPRLKDLYVVLHTSLSGVFNKALIEKVGANNFIAKFQPDVLAKEILNVVELRHERK
ncbi:MAG: chemotaxis protein CheV [Gammaproteobacteria bacterium]